MNTHAWHACKHGFVVQRCRCMNGAHNVINDRECPITSGHAQFLLAQTIEHAGKDAAMFKLKERLDHWLGNINSNLGQNSAHYSDYTRGRAEGQRDMIEDINRLFFYQKD